MRLKGAAAAVSLRGLALAILIAASPAAKAASLDTLYRFTGAADGAHPNGGFVFDSAGALYGTTGQGGVVSAACPAGCGTLFKVDPAGHETTLYSFTHGADGASPNGGLVADSTGLIYGTTGFGGAYYDGTIFKFDPATGRLSTLYAFTGAADSGHPNGPLLIGSNGALYGTTFTGNGPTHFEGTVFKFYPPSGKLNTLHTFDYADGEFPLGGLIYGSTQTAIFGTTSGGGANGGGTVFKLNPATGVLTTIHAFTGGADGAGPTGTLLFRSGALYGETNQGGAGHNGTVFKLNPSNGVLTVLHSFTGEADGGGPIGGLVSNASGGLYGETGSGGTGGNGILFKVSPAGPALTVLHSFTGGADGGYPNSGLMFDSAGNLYGAAATGATLNSATCWYDQATGPFGCGTIFKLVP
jgi:uncharacterized repeat protein (TIGR03803 family)